jgi:hypothetical protein
MYRIAPVDLFAHALSVLLPAALAYDTAPTDAAVMMTPSVNALSLLNCMSISLETV